jgi:hypothetical protein
VHEPEEADITLIGVAGAATKDGPGSTKLNVGDSEPSKLISLDEDDNVIVEGVPGHDAVVRHACAEFAGDTDELEYGMSIPDEVSASFDDINSSDDGVVFGTDGLVRDAGLDFEDEAPGLDTEGAVFVFCDREEEDSALMSLGSGEDGVDSSSENSDTSDDEDETRHLKFSFISRSLHLRGTISLKKASSSLLCTNSETCLYSRVLALLLSL